MHTNLNETMKLMIHALRSKGHEVLLGGIIDIDLTNKLLYSPDRDVSDAAYKLL